MLETLVKRRKKPTGAFSRLILGLDSIILDDRDAFVLQHAVAEVEAGRDVALVWGAGHVPGMVTSLCEAGWEVKDVRWRQWREFSAPAAA